MFACGILGGARFLLPNPRHRPSSRCCRTTFRPDPRHRPCSCMLLLGPHSGRIHATDPASAAQGEILHLMLMVGSCNCSSRWDPATSSRWDPATDPQGGILQLLLKVGSCI